jgi:hypothetical protein
LSMLTFQVVGFVLLALFFGALMTADPASSQ